MRQEGAFWHGQKVTVTVLAVAPLSLPPLPLAPLPLAPAASPPFTGVPSGLPVSFIKRQLSRKAFLPSLLYSLGNPLCRPRSLSLSLPHTLDDCYLIVIMVVIYHVMRARRTGADRHRHPLEQNNVGSTVERPLGLSSPLLLFLLPRS